MTKAKNSNEEGRSIFDYIDYETGGAASYISKKISNAARGVLNKRPSAIASVSFLASSLPMANAQDDSCASNPNRYPNPILVGSAIGLSILCCLLAGNNSPTPPNNRHQRNDADGNEDLEAGVVETPSITTGKAPQEATPLLEEASPSHEESNSSKSSKSNYLKDIIARPNIERGHSV